MDFPAASFDTNGNLFLGLQRRKTNFLIVRKQGDAGRPKGMLVSQIPVGSLSTTTTTRALIGSSLTRKHHGESETQDNQYSLEFRITPPLFFAQAENFSALDGELPHENFLSFPAVFLIQHRDHDHVEKRRSEKSSQYHLRHWAF